MMSIVKLQQQQQLQQKDKFLKVIKVSVISYD